MLEHLYSVKWSRSAGLGLPHSSAKRKRKKPSRCSREDDYVGKGWSVTVTGMQESPSAYPYRRFRLTHEVKVVTRGLPSGHRRRERKRFTVRENKSI